MCIRDRVYPTHGAGSFCSAPPGAERTSSIGAEKATNPYLAARDEDAFVAMLLASLGSYPAVLRPPRRDQPAGAGPAGDHPDATAAVRWPGDGTPETGRADCRCPPAGGLRGRAHTRFPVDCVAAGVRHLARLAGRYRAASHHRAQSRPCLLYTSDAADDLTRVDLGGRR